jgi:hypothetical protein
LWGLITLGNVRFRTYLMLLLLFSRNQFRSPRCIENQNLLITQGICYVCWYRLHFNIPSFRIRVKVTYLYGAYSLYTYSNGPHASNTASKGFSLFIFMAPHTIIPSLCTSVFYFTFDSKHKILNKWLQTRILLRIYISYYYWWKQNIEVDWLVILTRISEVPGSNTTGDMLSCVFS